jgi:hypothetical protein
MAQENRFKKIHAEINSAPHVQVSAGKVCKRQVGDLAGVNVLWDAEINSA